MEEALDVLVWLEVGRQRDHALLPVGSREGILKHRQSRSSRRARSVLRGPSPPTGHTNTGQRSSREMTYARACPQATGVTHDESW